MVVPVHAIHVHRRYRGNHHDNDLALLELTFSLRFGPALIHLCLPTRDFCENILMQSGKTGMTTRRRLEAAEELVYMSLDECRHQLNVSHPLSNKMFCMSTPPETTENRTQETQSSGSEVRQRRRLKGTPVATAEQGTMFVTGLLKSSSVGCDSDCGLVFTKLSRYLNWIQPKLEAAEDHMTSQVNLYPDTH